VTQVPDPETYFQMDEFQDLTNTSKPVIFISEDEMFSIHEMLETHLDVLVGFDAKISQVRLIAIKLTLIVIHYLGTRRP
jgi:hypothetical protein